MHTKKGISAVIATVLIILITIAAIIILWAALIPLIKGHLEKESKCQEAIQQLSIDFVCKNASRLYGLPGQHNNITYDKAGFVIKISRGPKEIDLEDLQFSLANSYGEKFPFKAKDYYLRPSAGFPLNRSDLPSPNGIRTYNIDLTELYPTGIISSANITFPNGTFIANHDSLGAAFTIIMNKEIGIAPVIMYNNKEVICRDMTEKTTEICSGYNP